MQKYWIGGRQAGKTVALMRWVEQQEDIPSIAVLCHVQAEAERLKRAWDKKYPEGPAPRFITYGQARNGSLDGRNTRIALDNLDIFLTHCFGYPVDLVTATGETL